MPVYEELTESEYIAITFDDPDHSAYPGFTPCAAAFRSISISNQSRSASYSFNDGRFIPGGDITPARSLRMTFSPQFRVITRCCEIQFLERQISSLDPVVMARDAILVEDRALGLRRAGRRL